jgi:hypothetical protein
VGGGVGILESKGECTWFQARDQSGWGFATMSETLVFQESGFCFSSTFLHKGLCPE